jgi:putative oxidoreductase
MSTKAIAIENGVEESKALNIALWVIQIGAAAMFIMAGANKVTGNEQMVGLFNAIGMGQWFRYFTGSLEITGTVLLLIPALSGLGGLLLTGVMVGAVATHIFIIGGNPTMAIVLLLASALIAFGRRQRTLKLIGL